jgi:hypothetical protein
MKITIKTLKGELFTVEAEPTETVQIGLELRSWTSRIRSRSRRVSKLTGRN